MKGLDLRKFKKMASDSKCTTLKSPEGHKIIIAHHAVSPAMRKELDAIPKKYADGGDTEEDTDYGTSSDVSYPVEQSAQDSAPVIEQAPENRAEMAAERMAPEAAPGQAPVPPPVAAPAPVRTAAPQASLASAPQRAPAEESAPAPEADPVPEQSAAAPAVQPQQSDYQKSYDDYKQEHQKEFAQEDAAFAQDLSNGHIQPKTYQDLYNKKDTLGKIGTLFGLMVSGMGAGLTHQPNAALAAMNQEIKNDLDAQVQSKTNAQNFLKLNQEQMRLGSEIAYKKQQGALTEAQTKGALAEANLKSYALANMQYNRTALHHQSLMVEKMPEGPMKQAAMQALAMMGTAVTNENAQIGDIAASKMALMKSMGGQDGGMNGTALRVMGQDKLADDQESKTIPGFSGRASAPMSANEKNELTKYATFDQQLGRFTDWAKKHSGILPTTPQNIATIKEGQTLARMAQNRYRDAQLNTVFRPSEAPLLNETIDSNPTKFMNKFRVVPQLDAIRKENMSQLNDAARAKGFQGYQGAQSSAAPAQQYKIVNGVKYMRGPDGKAYPVK